LRESAMAGKNRVSGEGVLDKVDEGRRAYLRKLAAGAAFVVPLVASFSTEGLRFNTAEAGYGGNQHQNDQGEDDDDQGDER